MKRKIYIALLIFFLVLMIISGFYIFAWLIENSKSESIRKEEEKHLIVKNDNYELDNGITRDNSDTVGWLMVPGTKINYPVVQHTDNNYYLKHDFNKNYNSTGWIFMDYHNKFDDQNIVIYGHHRHDNSMFGSVDLLFNEDFYKNNENEIILVTESGTFKYKIFSVYRTSKEDFYNSTRFSDFNKTIDILRNRSQINFKEETAEVSQVITLSTCSADNKGRLVVHGYKK